MSKLFTNAPKNSPTKKVCFEIWFSWNTNIKENIIFKNVKINVLLTLYYWLNIKRTTILLSCYNSAISSGNLRSKKYETTLNFGIIWTFIYIRRAYVLIQLSPEYLDSSFATLCNPFNSQTFLPWYGLWCMCRCGSH